MDGKPSLDPGGCDFPLTWDDSLALARLLRQRHPTVPIEQVSRLRLYRWVLELPEFQDDPALANDSILDAILKEWLESLPR